MTYGHLLMWHALVFDAFFSGPSVHSGLGIQRPRVKSALTASRLPNKLNSPVSRPGMVIPVGSGTRTVTASPGVIPRTMTGKPGIHIKQEGGKSEYYTPKST